MNTPTKEGERMKPISTSPQGQIKLSTRKILVLSLIVGFFSIVAHSWEGRQRRVFRNAVKYKTFSTDKLKKILSDFEFMISCKDPYIENFIKKNPEFTTLHHLWTLNSHEYWTGKFRQEINQRERQK